MNLFEKLDGFKRKPEESLPDFFRYTDEIIPLVEPSDLILLDIFRQFGICFSKIEHISVPTNEEKRKSWEDFFENVTEGHCHQYAYEMHTEIMKRDVSLNPKIWWGFADFWTGDTYHGMYCHSFVTVSRPAMTKICDPAYIKNQLDGSDKRATNYYGIQIPVSYIEELENSMHGSQHNYSGYIKKVVVKDHQKTADFVRILEKQQGIL
jgi:hypothetical protein